jgi:predicted DNA-binding transcriptional regulator YafY
MNRIDRLTAIIVYLQGRRFTSVDELAGRYGISARTVYRDLKALQEAGVPIGFEPGRGYYIVKGYHLPPVMFSREEAASLLAGERLMQKWRDTGLGKAYLSALEKIRAILPPDDKEYFETLEKHVQVFRYGDEKDEPQPDEKIFVFLQNAIFRKEVIEISYHSPYRRETTRRKTEPLGLLLMSGRWYLAGWCRLREDYRMFRLDRFEGYKLTGEKIPDPPLHTLQEFYDRNLHEEKELEEVVVRFENEMARFIGDQKYRHGWAWEQNVDGGVEMTFLCSHTEHFCRWLLIWGNSATVLKYGKVKKRLRELARELNEHVG